MKQGYEAQGAANLEAAQLEARAGLERALGQREAERLRKASARIRARQRAVLAASGFSASDVGAEAITADTVKEASIQELLALAQAEDAARQDDFRAIVRRNEGKQARQAGQIGAVTTLIQGASSWRDLFGNSANSDDGSDAFKATPPIVMRGL